MEIKSAVLKTSQRSCGKCQANMYYKSYLFWKGDKVYRCKKKRANGWTLQLGKRCKFSSFPEGLILPLTVKEAVEVWLPTEKVTVPESAFVTPLSVRLWTQPSAFIRFISLFWSGTSWSFHTASGASACETRHSKWTSSPSKTTQLSKNFCMLTSTSAWHNI